MCRWLALSHGMGFHNIKSDSNCDVGDSHFKYPTWNSESSLYSNHSVQEMSTHKVEPSESEIVDLTSSVDLRQSLDPLHYCVISDKPQSTSRNLLLSLSIPHSLSSNGTRTGVAILAVGGALATLAVNFASESSRSSGLRMITLLGFVSTEYKAPSVYLPLDSLILALLLAVTALLAAFLAGSTGLAGAGRAGVGWKMAELFIFSSSFRTTLNNLLIRACQLSCQLYLATQALKAGPRLVMAAMSPRKSPNSTFSSSMQKSNQSEDPNVPPPTQPIKKELFHDITAAPAGIPSLVHPLPLVAEVAPVTERDLAVLMWRLECPSGDHTSNLWEPIVEKESESVKYSVKRRDPQDGGATEYLSRTTFKNCTAQSLRDFYMDSDFLLQWDGLVKEYANVALSRGTGIETGRFVKKYPFCSPREFVLAWKVWEKEQDKAGKDESVGGSGKVYYCITKAVEHPLVPRQQKLKRVTKYTSMWRIATVPGTNSAEIHLYIQEDNGMQREIAKMAFRRNIWSYIRKTDEQLRKHIQLCTFRPNTGGDSAVSLVSKVPENLVPEEVSKTPSGMKKRGSLQCLASLLGLDADGEISAEVSSDESEVQSSVNSLEENTLRNEQRGGCEKWFRIGGRVFSSALIVSGTAVLALGSAPFSAKVAAAYVLQSIITSQKSLAQN